jgi:hypothetical protein
LSFFVLRIPLIHIINPTLVGMKRGLFMSYMNTHAAFAPAGGIQELSFDEIDLVSGGHDSVVIDGATYGGAINGTRNGVRGHYDVYHLENGCTVYVWNSGS